MARKYRKVYQNCWSDEKFRKLTPAGRLLALYVITGQSNRLGIFYFSIGQAAEQTGLPADSRQEPSRNPPETFPGGSPGVEKGLLETLAEVCQTLGWRWDPDSRVVFLPSWWKHNPPENPNVLKGALSDLEELPQTPLLAEFWANDRHLAPGAREVLQEAARNVAPNPTETPTEPYPNQEQEQEQEQDSSSSAVASKGESDKPTKPKTKSGGGSKHKDQSKARQPNPLFDAVAEVTGSDPVVSGSHIGKITALLRQADPPYTPDEVREFGRQLPRLCTWTRDQSRPRPTLGEIEKYIGLLRSAAKPAPIAVSHDDAAKRTRERVELAMSAPAAPEM